LLHGYGQKGSKKSIITVKQFFLWQQLVETQEAIARSSSRGLYRTLASARVRHDAKYHKTLAAHLPPSASVPMSAATEESLEARIASCNNLLIVAAAGLSISDSLPNNVYGAFCAATLCSGVCLKRLQLSLPRRLSPAVHTHPTT
jgi:hypothetical protein